MLSTMFFLLATSTPAVQDAAHPAHAGTAAVSGQSANGGKPQRVDTTAPRSTAPNEHWTDGMNTKRAPDPRKRDEYGAPKVTPPTGQGTDNPGGIPEPRRHPPHAKSGEGKDD